MVLRALYQRLRHSGAGGGHRHHAGPAPVHQHNRLQIGEKGGALVNEEVMCQVCEERKATDECVTCHKKVCSECCIAGVGVCVSCARPKEEGLIPMLISCGAVQYGTFTLASGKESNYYVDMKLAITDIPILRKVSEMMAPYIGPNDKIGCVELGAVPIAVSLSLQTERPYLIVRKQQKEHGTKKPFEGELTEGEKSKEVFVEESNETEELEKQIAKKEKQLADEKKKVKKLVQDKDLKNVDFYPYQPLDRLPETLTCADISVVSEDRRVNGLCSSSKLYSSLASGQAVLALVNKDSDVAEIVRRCDCGFIVNQGDADQVVNRLKFFLCNGDELGRMGKRARKHFEEYYTIKDSIEKYVRMLEEV